MAKPKLALIPAAQGDKFYSVLPSDGVGDFDFTRASTGTRIAPTGLIEEVASGDSRLNYDLLNGKVVNCPHYLLEPARTNLYSYSSAFTNINAFSLTVTDNVAISPQGNLNASSIIPSTSNTVHYLNYPNNSSGTVTLSIYAKANGYNYIFLHLYDGSNGRAWFNLENGVIGTTDASISAKIEKMPNGWYRCIITRVLSGNLIQADIAVSENDNIGSFSGNGTSGLYIFGAQLETGSYPTSYIPTNGTAITRAAETADDSGDAATFNDSEGVLMAEISALADDLTFRLISLSDGTSNNRIYLGFNNTTNTIYLVSEVGGLTQVLITYAVTNITDFMKLAVKYKVNDYSLYFNGFEVATDTLGTVPIGLNSLQFNSGAGFSTFYGNTREVQYFNSVLTDAQLETLTSWTSLQEMITSQLYTNY